MELAARPFRLVLLGNVKLADIKSPIGEACWAMRFENWRRTRLNQYHWKVTLSNLLKGTHPAECVLNPCTAQPWVIPYEAEFGFKAD